MVKRLGRLWWAILPLILIAAYAVVGFYVVPRYAATKIPEYVHGTLHRDATVGAIRFNPFTLDAEIHDLAIKDADGEPMLGFARLHVRLGLLSSIARRGYVISAIGLEQLAVHATRRADKSINLQALAPPSTAKDDAPAKPLPRLYIDSLSVTEAKAWVKDLARVQALNVEFIPVSFELTNFATTSEDNRFGFTASTARGESLAWHGSFGLKPLASTGEFTLGRILATTISQVGFDFLPLDITKGELDLAGSYQFRDTGNDLLLKLKLPKVELRDVGLRARGEAEDWVTLPKLTVTDTALDLGAQTIDIASVSLEQPRVTAWLDHDGNLNLAKLYSTEAALPEAAPTDKPRVPWKIRLPLAQITGLDARFEDRKPATVVALHLAPVDVTVRDVAVPFTTPIALEASIGINGSGRLKATGPVTVAPLGAKLSVEAEAVDLKFVQPYLEQATKLTLLSGSLAAKLKVNYAAAGPGSTVAPLDLLGDVTVSDLHTQDQLLHLDFVNWKQLALKDLVYHSAPYSVAVREVVAREPYARIVIGPDHTLNVNNVLGIKPAPDTAAGDDEAQIDAPAPKPAATRSKGDAPPVRPAPPPVDQPVSVRLVRIENGSMNFADLTVQPNFATGIQMLDGTIRGISGKVGSKAEIDLKGKVDRYAPVTITGQMDVLSVATYTEVKMDFRNIELTTFSPYSGKFAGYRIEKGKMSLQFEYHIHARALDAKHKLVLDQFELGERVDSADATHLPVKLAIALLKDSDGVIDLDLPVTGSLDDPQFRLAPLIWKVLKNLLVKIVSSPFKLLGALFGGGGDAPEQLLFAPGSAELNPDAASQVGVLRKGLAARPGLKLDIPMALCPASDGAALGAGAWKAHVEGLARTRLAGKSGKPPSAEAVDALLGDPKSYRKLLEADYRATDGAAAAIPSPAPGTDPNEAAVSWLEAALKPAVSVPPEQLNTLARERAQAIQRALLDDNSRIAPERVFLVTDKETDCSDPDAVKLKLALK